MTSEGQRTLEQKTNLLTVPNTNAYEIHLSNMNVYNILLLHIIVC